GVDSVLRDGPWMICGITRFPSVTKGDVPSSSNLTYGQTEGIAAINATNVSNDSLNTSESINVPTGNDESAIPHTSTAGPHFTNSSYANKLSPTSLTKEVYDHGSHDGLKEGITRFPSVTKGDVPSSSNPTYGQTEGIAAINATNVSTVDVSNDSLNTSESINVPTGNDESAIPHTSTAGPHFTNSSYANKLSPTS
nr:hypothetical protein [Tanacetum cinerariifolium]